MTKIKTRKTADERRAEAEALHESIAAQIEQLTTTEGWQQFLRMATGFHHFSLSNLLLILRQRPDATKVAGYRQWLARGRQVKKGERGIRIFGYSTKKIEPTEGSDEEERRAVYFPVLIVFDVAQTEPIDGADVDAPDLAPRLVGGDDAGVFDATTAWLGSIGWTVERKALGGEDGRSAFDTHQVVIHEQLEPAHEALTILHEAGHMLMHAEVTDYQQHRGIYETEAESVAHVVAGVLGLDSSANSIGYIAGWTGGDTDQVKATAGRVLSAVRTILDGITEDDPER